MNKHLTRMQDIIKNSNYNNLIFTDFYNLYYLTEIKIDSGERMIALLINERGNYLFINHLFYVDNQHYLDIILWDLYQYFFCSYLKLPFFLLPHDLKLMLLYRQYQAWLLRNCHLCRPIHFSIL